MRKYLITGIDRWSLRGSRLGFLVGFLGGIRIADPTLTNLTVDSPAGDIWVVARTTRKHLADAVRRHHLLEGTI